VLFPYFQPINRQAAFIARSKGNPTADKAKEFSAAAAATNGRADLKNVRRVTDGKGAAQLVAPPQLPPGKWV
jgi:hypothetical protein